MNQDGREVPYDLPRVDFVHWVAVELPAELRSIRGGGVLRRRDASRKERRPRPPWLLAKGLNDFTGCSPTTPTWPGKYFGYDGPAPPWNDSILHHYTFTVYALDIEEVPVVGEFTGQQVRDAIWGHVLAEASIMGTYTQNPRLAELVGTIQRRRVRPGAMT